MSDTLPTVFSREDAAIAEGHGVEVIVDSSSDNENVQLLPSFVRLNIRVEF